MYIHIGHPICSVLCVTNTSDSEPKKKTVESDYDYNMKSLAFSPGKF